MLCGSNRGGRSKCRRASAAPAFRFRKPIDTGLLTFSRRLRALPTLVHWYPRRGHSRARGRMVGYEEITLPGRRHGRETAELDQRGTILSLAAIRRTAPMTETERQLRIRVDYYGMPLPRQSLSVLQR